MIIFTLGIVEMFVISYWTKAVVESRIFMSGIITVINIFIWFYILRTFVDNLDNLYLVLTYALGCAIGTMLSSLVSNQEKTRKNKKVKKALTKLKEQALVLE